MIFSLSEQYCKKDFQDVIANLLLDISGTEFGL